MACPTWQCPTFWDDTISTLMNIGPVEPVSVPSDGPPHRSPTCFVLPNPARGPISFHFTLARAGRSALSVYDMEGRLVRIVFDREFEAGSQFSSWDLRDGRGSPAPAGVSFVVLRADGQQLCRRAVVLK